MDSILADHVRLGKLVRPASYSHAVSAFPKFILRLKQQKLQILISNNINAKPIVQAHNKTCRSERWLLLKSDFDICKSIALRVKLRLFPSDRLEDAEERIKALVKLEFANRGF